MEELETLEHLQVLTIRFKDLPLPLERFLSSHRLTSCTRGVKMWDIDLESSGISLPVTMDKLRYLWINDCRISEIRMVKICNESKTVSPLHNPRNPCFSSLSQVFLEDCKCVKELTFLMFAPNLTELTIETAIDLEDIINKEGIVPFLKLYRLVLYDLPELKNIYWSPLPFSCLKLMHVLKCPNLKKLPLNSQSGKQGVDGLFINYGEKEWIEAVEWEDEATQTRFLSSCQQGRQEDLVAFY